MRKRGEMFMLRRAKKGSTLKRILDRIENADDSEISEIINAVVRRYGRVYPDWDVMFLSVRKDPEKRKEDVEGIIRMLRGTECGE